MQKVRALLRRRLLLLQLLVLLLLRLLLLLLLTGKSQHQRLFVHNTCRLMLQLQARLVNLNCTMNKSENESLGFSSHNNNISGRAVVAAVVVVVAVVVGVS